MPVISIDNTDPRHPTLQKGFNLRWPVDNIQGQSAPRGADNIYLCASIDDIISAAAAGLKDGGRITVRSGGHCYEGFVSNKLSGESAAFSIIDISLLTGVEYSDTQNIGTDFASDEQYRFKMLAGSQNWENYAELYKATGKTIPGGSCYSVGAGGHICGGGYGYLSRKYGLSSDWLSGVDILVPDETGTGLKGVHVSRHTLPDIADIDDDGYLFLACCGGGGGQFGIITAYYFDDLPTAPTEVLWTVLEWQQSDITRTDFDTFLNAYYTWFAKNDNDPNTWGLFTKLDLRHVNSGPINLGIHFIDSSNGVTDTAVLEDFYTSVVATLPGARVSLSAFPASHASSNSLQCMNVDTWADFESHTRRMDWLWFTQNVNASGDNKKGRYKSAYQKGGKETFASVPATALWNAITVADPQSLLTNSGIQIQSYGGQINQAAGTAVGDYSALAQRDSVLKWQPRAYWYDTQNMSQADIQALDESYAVWLRTLYSDAFPATLSGQSEPGIPVNDYFDGCYFNYPDLDMKYKNGNANGNDPENPQWRSIYFPRGKEAMLAHAKAIWDPLNLFRHEMSVLPATER
ncbi:FAD-binding protein [Klebsiella aerogenes]|uniref:FAD-binding protein n=1 Tax=Klebsiella aerogenes TaxID=548 RepID=A0AAP9QZF0_KLEAE|nr:FAD-binding protein [Klebsiella aerogenes]QMR41483.1 FAD-binding protein [Klebsiella aerogenes]